jgi:hypothetical protein
MLKVTSQQLMDAVGIDCDQVGRPVVLGSVADGEIPASGNTVIKKVPAGFVLLATKIVAQAYGCAGISGALGTKDSLQGSPNQGSGGASGFLATDFEQEDGSPSYTMSWQRQARYNSLFGSAASPDWRTANPANVVTWSPKYPIVVPSGWVVTTGSYTGYAEWAGGQAIYGLLVSEDDARQLGFAISGQDADALRNASVVSSVGNGGTQTLLAGRAGKSIRILDIQVRLQAVTNTLTTMELRQSDGSRTICKFASSNPAEMIDEAFSPEIYLKAGADLQVVTNDTEACSVNVSYEFVDDDQVPGDAFWAAVTPTIPGPAGGTSGVDSAFCASIEKLTLYYPRLDTTKTAAGKGRQHLLRGFCVSAQKDGVTGGTSDDVDQQSFAIVGASDSGTVPAIGHSSALAVNLTFDNVNAELLSPALTFVNHDQNLTGVWQGLNAPTAENGVLRLDMVNMAAAPATVIGTAVTPSDGSVADWSVTVWGRTIPSRFTAPINRTY